MVIVAVILGLKKGAAVGAWLCFGDVVFCGGLVLESKICFGETVEYGFEGLI